MNERCNNWPCQLENHHVGPCSTNKDECMCVSADSRWCYLIRYDIDPASECMDDGRCECSCHTPPEDEE